MSAPRDHHMPLQSHRGMALFIALVALVVATTMCLTFARAATTTAIHRKTIHRLRLADELMHAADAPILDWLTHQSQSVVLPPDSVFPSVVVLDDCIVVDNVQACMRITAWDECGRAPAAALARSGSPLRMALPEHVLHVIDEAATSTGANLGVDDFGMASDSHVPVFPCAGHVDAPRWFGDVSAEQSRRDAFWTAPPNAEAAIGAWVSTHNRDPVRINVNTAPMALLEQAMRLAGRGGMDAILEARAAGRPANVPTEPHHHFPHQNPSHTGDLRLVNQSHMWAFRVDVVVSGIRPVTGSAEERGGRGLGGRSSRWQVYVRSPITLEWERLQQRVIAE